MHTALLALTLALAQTDQPAPQDGAEASALPPPSAELSLSAQHNFASDFSDSEGEVAVTRVGADADLTFATSQRGRLAVGLWAERSVYDFTDATGFVSGSSEPWDDIMAGGASLRFSRQHDERWSYFASVDAQSWGQDNAEFSDTLTYGGVVGVMYAQSESLRYGFGLGAHTRLEDDTTFLPIPIIAWRIDDHWSIGSTPRRGGGQIALTYAYDESLSVSAAVGFESRDFRLSRDAAQPEGVGRDSRIPVSVAVDWRVHPQVRVRGEVGANLSQEFTLDDVEGNRVSKQDADMGFFAGVGVTVEF
jgi:hypothetical protein